jgi:hypothetical protein
MTTQKKVIFEWLQSFRNPVVGMVAPDVVRKKLFVYTPAGWKEVEISLEEHIAEVYAKWVFNHIV